MLLSFWSCKSTGIVVEEEEDWKSEKRIIKSLLLFYILRIYSLPMLQFHYQERFFSGFNGRNNYLTKEIIFNLRNLGTMVEKNYWRWPIMHYNFIGNCLLAHFLVNKQCLLWKVLLTKFFLALDIILTTPVNFTTYTFFSQ